MEKYSITLNLKVSAETSEEVLKMIYGLIEGTKFEFDGCGFGPEPEGGSPDGDGGFYDGGDDYCNPV